MKTVKFRSYLCLVIFVGCLVLSAPIYGRVDQPADGHRYGLIKQQLHDYFDQLCRDRPFSGTVLVAWQGKILLKKGYGMADYEAERPNTPATIFSIASLTKAFTAMSIMILEERGLLRVTDTIDRYIPGFPGGDRLTLHQLLNQSSGLFEFLNHPWLWENCTLYHEPVQLLCYYMDEALQFPPGTCFQYCNSNYITLGIIIERVSGLSYGDFLKQNILNPLQLKSTGYSPDGCLLNRMAKGYDDITAYPPVPTMEFHLSLAFSAGAMYSTVEDMYEWDRALYTEKLVSAASLEKLFTPGLGDYGYGWFIDNLAIDGQAHKHIWHWGAYFGFHSFISRLVNDELTVILLLNISPALGTAEDLKPLATEAARIVLGSGH